MRRLAFIAFYSILLLNQMGSNIWSYCWCKNAFWLDLPFMTRKNLLLTSFFFSIRPLLWHMNPQKMGQFPAELPSWSWIPLDTRNAVASTAFFLCCFSAPFFFCFRAWLLMTFGRVPEMIIMMRVMPELCHLLPKRIDLISYHPVFHLKKIYSHSMSERRIIL